MNTTVTGGMVTKNSTGRKRGRPRKYPRSKDCPHNDRPEHVNGVCYQCSSNANNKEKKINQNSGIPVKAKIPKRTRKKGTSEEQKRQELQEGEANNTSIVYAPNQSNFQMPIGMQHFGSDPTTIMQNYHAFLAHSMQHNPYYMAYNQNNFMGNRMQDQGIAPGSQTQIGILPNNYNEMVVYGEQQQHNAHNTGNQQSFVTIDNIVPNISGIENDHQNSLQIVPVTQQNVNIVNDDQNMSNIEHQQNTNTIISNVGNQFSSEAILNANLGNRLISNIHGVRDSNLFASNHNKDVSPNIAPNQEMNQYEIQSCNVLAQLGNEIVMQNKAYDEKRVKKMRENMANGIVNFNIGGKIFTTSVETLMKQNNSIFYNLTQNPFDFKLDSSGCFFFDRNSKFFEMFLDYLRILPNKYNLSFINNMDSSNIEILLKEAEYYGLADLEGKIRYEIATTSFDNATKKGSENYNSPESSEGDNNSNKSSYELTSNISEVTYQENTGAKVILIQKSSKLKFKNDPLDPSGQTKLKNKVYVDF
jgi:hypothetical protein